MRALTISLFLVTFASSSISQAEQVEIPLPKTLEEKAPSKEPNALWPALVGSVLATVASGGKAVYFPLLGPRDAPILFRMTTPGQSPEKADESFTIARLDKIGDERAEAETRAKQLTKICPDFPAKVVEMPNGKIIVERESTNCLQPGYRLTINRTLKGADGAYQVVYLARRVKPPDEVLQEWRVRISEAKLVP